MAAPAAPVAGCPAPAEAGVAVPVSLVDDAAAGLTDAPAGLFSRFCSASISICCCLTMSSSFRTFSSSVLYLSASAVADPEVFELAVELSVGEWAEFLSVPSPALALEFLPPPSSTLAALARPPPLQHSITAAIKINHIRRDACQERAVPPFPKLSLVFTNSPPFKRNIEIYT